MHNSKLNMKRRISALLLLLVILCQPLVSNVYSMFKKDIDLGTKVTVPKNYYTVTYYNSDDTVFESENELLTDLHTLQFTTGTETNSQGQTIIIPENATFNGWVNAVGGTPDLTGKKDISLFPSFTYQETIYNIRFMDEKGQTLLMSGTFTSNQVGNSASSLITPPTPPDLSSQNMAFMGWLVRTDGGSTPWEGYTLPAADVVVYATYSYTGNIGFKPVDTDGDGTIDHYTVVAIDDLPAEVVVPGTINGIPVEEIDKLYSGSGTDGKLNQQVQSIILGEGVKIIRSKALSATPNLATVKLPSTIEEIEGNAFALNGQEKGKVVIMEFNGTKAQWDAIDKASSWAKGLSRGTKVICKDGEYALRGSGGNISFTWTAY